MFRSRLKTTRERLDAARTAGDPVAFLALARKAVASFPRDDEVLLSLARALGQNERFDEAEEVAAEVADRSSDAAVLVQAASIFTAVKRPARTNAALAKVFATGPHSPQIQNEASFLRGVALNGLGRPKLAEKYLREALAGDDQRPDFIYGLALFLVVHERRDEAVLLVAVARNVIDDDDRAEILADLAKKGLVGD